MTETPAADHQDSHAPSPVDFSERRHRPGKVIALHLNYPSRIAQRGRSPKFPGYFLKAGTSIASTGD